MLGSLCESGKMPDFFCMDNKNIIVGKAETKLTIIKTVSDLDSVPIIKIFCDLLGYHDEKDAEKGRCQDATLIHSVDDREDL